MKGGGEGGKYVPAKGARGRPAGSAPLVHIPAPARNLCVRVRVDELSVMVSHIFIFNGLEKRTADWESGAAARNRQSCSMRSSSSSPI